MARRLLLVLGCLSLLWLAAGCASPGDSTHRSERPWNSPRSWEHGVPSSMMEGR